MEMIEKTSRTCGNCGDTGHNARTCKEPKRATVEAPAPSGRTCGNCGETGHNARTCGNPKAAESVADQRSARFPVADPKPEGQGRTCGICGNTGHNARTCKTSPMEKAQAARASGEGKKTSSFTVTPDTPAAPKSFAATETFCPLNEDGKHVMKKDANGEWCDSCSRYNPSKETIATYKQIQAEKVAATKK